MNNKNVNLDIQQYRPIRNQQYRAEDFLKLVRGGSGRNSTSNTTFTTPASNNAAKNHDAREERSFRVHKLDMMEKILL